MTSMIVSMIHPPKTDDRPLWDVLFGIFGYPALFIGHRLKLFPLLAETPRSLPEICTALGLERRTAQILVSTATALGFLELADSRYRLTALSEEYLLEGSPHYFGHYWDLLIDNAQVFSFDALTKAITRNEPQAYGVEDIYQTHRQETERTQHFTRAMHSISVTPAAAWTRAIDLSGHRSLLDIGGGSGAHSIVAAKAWPHLHATIFDLATVCPVTEEFIAREGLQDRVGTHPGDMWQTPYPAADIHFYSHVYHGWRPEKCRFLSRKSYESLPSGGRIVIHEFLYDDRKTGPFPAAAMSMVMLGWGEGEQYSGAELRQTLEDAGFQDVAIQPTFGYYSIVTGRKP